jgi:subtilisin family serine protease
MRNFWKGAGRVAALAIGAKVIAELVKCCRKLRDCPEPKTTVDNTGAKYIPNQLVVFKRPGVSDKDFLEWKRNNKPIGVRQKKLCEYCDGSLELWEGNNVSTFIVGKDKTIGNSAGGGGTTGGGDDIACYSYNLIIDLPEPGVCIQDYNDDRKEILPQPDYNDPPVIIAVFDTGLDPAIKKLYTNIIFSCMPDGNLGWNFAADKDKKTNADKDKKINTDDDHPSKHGSRVAKFIIDQAHKFKKQKINILPVKIHNSHGKSDLFSVLCGLAYAANSGAKIINASFGFYGASRSEAPTILDEFVKKHLTDRNILLIAAAGNLDSDKSLTASELEAVRDLNINPFYPACLAKKFSNVIAVTTVSLKKDKVSPSQNFSNAIVDIGAVGDSDVKNDYRFKDPLQNENANETNFILGSSFATPVVTGILAQHYQVVTDSMVNGSINKPKLIEKLFEQKLELNFTENNPLSEFVKNGIFCMK